MRHQHSFLNIVAMRATRAAWRIRAIIVGGPTSSNRLIGEAGIVILVHPALSRPPERLGGSARNLENLLAPGTPYSFPAFFRGGLQLYLTRRTLNEHNRLREKENWNPRPPASWVKSHAPSRLAKFGERELSPSRVVAPIIALMNIQDSQHDQRGSQRRGRVAKPKAIAGTNDSLHQKRHVGWQTSRLRDHVA